MSNPPNTGRPWTTEEDNLLKEAVYIYGENTEKWKIIATHVPGRTNKACRKVPLHPIHLNVDSGFNSMATEMASFLISLREENCMVGRGR